MSLRNSFGEVECFGLRVRDLEAEFVAGGEDVVQDRLSYFGRVPSGSEKY